MVEHSYRKGCRDVGRVGDEAECGSASAGGELVYAAFISASRSVLFSPCTARQHGETAGAPSGPRRRTRGAPTPL